MRNFWYFNFSVTILTNGVVRSQFRRLKRNGIYFSVRRRSFTSLINKISKIVQRMDIGWMGAIYKLCMTSEGSSPLISSFSHGDLMVPAMLDSSPLLVT